MSTDLCILSDEEVKYMQVNIKSTIVDPRIYCRKRLTRFIENKAVDWETECKRIISNELIDTGELLNSIRTEINLMGFAGISSAKHAKFSEFGTQPHWVPWYSKSGEEVLASWGRRVLGLSKEEMEKSGGIVVSNEEIAFMRRSLNKL